MTAINRPIDSLLNTETLKSGQSARHQSALTDSNARKNTFSELLSAKQKEADIKENKASESRSPEGQGTEKADDGEAGKDESHKPVEGTGSVDNGNNLPPGQSGKAPLQEDAYPAISQSANQAADDVAETAQAGQKVASLLNIPEVVAEEDAAEGQSQELAKTLLTPANPETAQNLLPFQGQASGQGEVIRAEELSDESNLLLNDEGEREGNAGISQEMTQVSDSSVTLVNEPEMETEASLPELKTNISLESGANQSIDTNPPLSAITLNSTSSPGAAISASGVLANQEQLKQVSAQIAPVLEEWTRMSSATNENTAKEGGKLDLNLPHQMKLETGVQNSGRQLPFGLELKQWLSEAKTSLDTAKTSTGSMDNAATVANTQVFASARLNSLTQAIQGLSTESTAPSPSLNIHPPVNGPGWGQVVAQRIAWLAGNGIKAAELQLNPKELGPVDVKISVNNDQTSIHFTSQHASVRDALELSVQRLRDMLESNGLGLADVNVSDQSGSEQQETAATFSDRTSADDVEREHGIEESLVRVAESHSLVDYYV